MKTQLQALTFSSRAARVRTAGYSGRLHSVFRRLVNVWSDGQLVSIADAELGQLPIGVHVHLAAGFSFHDCALAPDMRTWSDGCWLEIAGGRLAIDLSHAEMVAAQKALVGPLLPRSACLARLKDAQAAGVAWASGDGLGPLWQQVGSIMSANPPDLVGAPAGMLCRAAVQPLSDLVAGLKSGDAARVSRSAGQLAGLGVGLTPSGDDVLTGIVGALSLCGAGRPAQAALSRLSNAVVSAAAGHTNDIAFTYLDCAARGEVSDALFGFISTLTTRAAAGVEAATRGLFAVGGTSGVELALGALIGVRVAADMAAQSRG